MNFMTVSTMLSSSSSSPQPVGTAFLGRVRLPSEACSIAAAASASFSSFFLMPYCARGYRKEKRDTVLIRSYNQFLQRDAGSELKLEEVGNHRPPRTQGLIKNWTLLRTTCYPPIRLFHYRLLSPPQRLGTSRFSREIDETLR
ncbi:hypothetical protein EYF80_022635 [Liparis tanakae]|uniref:Uncharacterized protein n=1 Tax=Liparis tanakae TaxID=230148 RepID=A0A4Z2HPC0_9TELE|nr:hypothetical protein EYF80_022635 [Liparis tanakae]